MRRIGMRWWTLAFGLMLGTALTGLGCAGSGALSPDSHQGRKSASHLEVGVDHLSNGRAALALREFLAAELIDPENPRVHKALSEAYLARGKRVEAESHLRRALEIEPKLHDARQSLTALLILDERYEEAIAECDELVDDPTYPMPWSALTNRASAEAGLGRMDDARESLILARDYRENYWPATLALAVIETEAGRLVPAIRLYRDVLAEEPDPGVVSEVSYRLAAVYVKLGKRREALGYLTASVARAPGSRWAKKSQEYLKLLH